jgi:Tetratricopeptide repeat
MKPVGRIVTLVACLLFAVSASAQKKQQAKALIQEGTRLYSAGEYSDAIDKFQAAYRLNQDPAMQFNIGQCHRKLGNHQQAVDAYQIYLRERPDAPNHAAVEGWLNEEQQAVDRARAAEEAARTPPPPPPAAAEPAPPAAAPAAKPDLGMPSKYALGVRVRGIFVPESFLKPYLKAATQMNSASIGLEFIYRKATYDVVTSLDFSFLNVDPGNYLANGHDASMDTHFVQFRNLNFLSADVSIIGHHTWDAAPWFELRYGAGLGIGVVLGDVLLTNNGMQCTDANASNIKQCYPINGGMPVRLGTKFQESDLQATQSNPGTDTAANPKRHVSADKPPVMGVLNVLIGFKFRLHKHVSAQVEVGFRDAMFVGAGLHYWF